MVDSIVIARRHGNIFVGQYFQCVDVILQGFDIVFLMMTRKGTFYVQYLYERFLVK